MMKRTLTAAAAAVLGLAGLSGAAAAQFGPGDHGGYDRHDQRGADRGGDHGGGDRGYCDREDGEHGGDRGYGDRGGGPRGAAYGYGRRRWSRGERIDRGEWGRYERVDWRRHHLRRPPPGYEWRYADGQYILAAAATGLIASIIAGSQ